MIILKKKKKTLQVYPIGTPKGALNTRRKVEFQGDIKFKQTPNGLKIYKYVVKRGDKEELLQPSDAIKLFRSQAVFLVDDDLKIQSFLESLNIKCRKTSICLHCTLDGYITIINSKSSFNYHNQRICKLCAEEVIKRELNYVGLDKQTFKNFRRILYKTHDLDEVLKVINPRFDPLKNANLTLFDTIKSSEDKRIPDITIDSLKIPNSFKKILTKTGNKKLLPVQFLALKHNLLNDESLLVVSATASGKTLIGELAGIPKAMRGKKFIFLTPLVALANQKYHDFKKKYSQIGLKIAIKVGMSRIRAREEIKLPKMNVVDADIIVATYEGLDFLLRSGQSNLIKDLGTVVVDEIHSLNDEDRGPRLNGLIKRLKNIFPKVQIIALSATVRNPKIIASEFGLTLVEYDVRPVPLERHIVFMRNDSDKKILMVRLVKHEFNTKSKKGFNGQTIIFTNSRRKTHLIANYLSRHRVKAAAYHAGLSYTQKERIENEFSKQKLEVVVTTAALAAGVDFPASQVIFDTLTMGNKWINSNEFFQMLGRAGRPTYHDRGIVYLLPEISKTFDNESEESVALDLLESDVDSINIEYSEDDTLEQILSDISSKSITSTEELFKNYKNINASVDSKNALEILESYGYINESYGKLSITNYGMAVSMSFLKPFDAEFIKKELSTKKSPLDIALELEPFESVYLSDRLHKQLTRNLKVNFSTRLFADSTLDIITTGENIVKLDEIYQNALINLQMDFLSCQCKDNPFCYCIERNLSEFIVKQRLKNKDPMDITQTLLKKYQIHAYPGDIFSWLDSLVRMLDAIKRISFALNYHKKVKECKKIIKLIERC